MFDLSGKCGVMNLMVGFLEEGIGDMDVCDFVKVIEELVV